MPKDRGYSSSENKQNAKGRSGNRKAFPDNPGAYVPPLRSTKPTAGPARGDQPKVSGAKSPAAGFGGSRTAGPKKAPSNPVNADRLGTRRPGGGR